MSDNPSRFEIATPEWRLSFQRCVGTGVGSNRGALPYHVLSRDDDLLRVLVPLPEDEALWIAWMLKPEVTASGFDIEGHDVRVSPVGKSGAQWSLFAADSVEHPVGRRGLNASTFTLAGTAEAAAQDHLRFDVRGNTAHTLQTVGIVLATPELYARLSGQQAPSPSVPDDAYRGWRLP